MNDIIVSKDFHLPVEAITQKIAIMGMSGSGKSNTAAVLVESFLALGAQVVILDKDGTWYGLRLARDGKSKGFDIPVFGGEHGDIPLDHRSGALVADIVVDRGISVVLDVSRMRKGKREHFATDFAEELFFRKQEQKSPMMFVIEEADTYLPQRYGTNQARMVGIYQEVQTDGRKYGIGTMIISQRPQAVDKGGLNQAAILFAHYMYGAHERKAMEEWIAEKHSDVKLVSELPHLEVGEAYIWSPRWLKTMRREQMPLRKTFDAAETPVFGKKQAKASLLAPSDLASLEEAMRDAIKQAEENDPVALKKQVAQLQQELAARKSQHSAVEVQVPIITDEQMSHLALMVQMFEGSREMLTDAAKTLHDDMEQLRIGFATLTDEMGKVTKTQSRAQQIHREIHATPVMRKLAAAREPKIDAHLHPKQQAILDALAWLESIGANFDQDIVAYLSDQSPTSDRYLGHLRTLRNIGYISWSNRTILFENKGRAAANEPDAPLTSTDVQTAVLSKLSGKPREMMEVLINAYPSPVSNEVLAGQTSQSITSDRFFAKIRWLEKMGVAERLQENGAYSHVKASDILFPS